VGEARKGIAGAGILAGTFVPRACSGYLVQDDARGAR
jgi:hypothetical protein